MIITKNIELKINPKNLKHFKDLGYNFNSGELVTLPIEHLSKGSNLKVEVKCDICNTCKFLSYKDYNKSMKTHNFYTCSSKCGREKFKITCLDKYGYENISQTNEIKKKVKNTIIQKYGVDNVMLVPEFSEKMKNSLNNTIENYNNDIVKKRKQTMLELYGVEYSSQHDNFKLKAKNTTLKNFGVDNVSKSSEIKEKKRQTTLKNLGVDNPLKSDVVKEKIKNTNIKKYGSEYPMHNELVKNKISDTNFKKYGVKNAMQNQKIFSKNKKSNFKSKEYIFPSGKSIIIQGFENLALDFILKKHSENDIIINDNEIEKIIGELWYLDTNNKKHRYFPDIFIISENKIIEVKSTWTYNVHENINLLKRQSCLDAGFKFEFMIFNKNKQLLA